MKLMVKGIALTSAAIVLIGAGFVYAIAAIFLDTFGQTLSAIGVGFAMLAAGVILMVQVRKGV